MACTIQYRNCTKIHFSKERFEKVLKKVCFCVKCSGVIMVSIVGAAEMKKLNTAYRGKKKETDVLSLNYGSKKGKGSVFGEIFLCLPMAKKQAKKMGHSLGKELEWLFVHGCLHIAGYDHKKKGDADVMNQCAKKILGK